MLFISIKRERCSNARVEICIILAAITKQTKILGIEIM